MRRARDQRLPAVLAAVASIATIMLAVTLVPEREASVAPREPARRALPEKNVDQGHEGLGRELDTLFGRAVIMLHARRYEDAVLVLHRALRLAPAMPEAHVNMGFALAGLNRPQAARDFFASAIELRPTQANAYYGLALSLEALCDLPGAVGSMRTYVHLSGPDDAFLPKARAALWEWGSAAEQGRSQPTDAQQGRAGDAVCGRRP